MKYAEVRTGRGGKSTRPGDDLGPIALRSRRSAESELENSREVEKKRRGQTALPLTSCGLDDRTRRFGDAVSDGLFARSRLGRRARVGGHTRAMLGLTDKCSAINKTNSMNYTDGVVA